MIAKREEDRIREIADELRTVRLGQAFDLVPVLREMRELLELEAVGSYMVRNRTGRWEVSHWEGVGLIDEAEPLARAMFATTNAFPLYYNPLSPPPEQRNRVVDALAWINASQPGTWDSNPMAVEILRPLDAVWWHQPRVLVCKGPTLLGWFGAMDPKPATLRQKRLLGKLAPPMRERLYAEQQLRDTFDPRPTVEAMLDHVGLPAFVVDAKGRIQYASASGLALLDDVRDSAAVIQRAVRTGRTDDKLELVPIESGRQRSWIAVVRTGGRGDARVARCLETCSRRWSLTPRQRQVLEHVVQGHSNATIASLLGCVERTVEQHVTAIFDRAGIDSRAALVATVLTSA